MYFFTIYCFFFPLLIPTKVEGYYIELVIAHSSSNLQNIIYVESKLLLILRCTVILCTACKEREKTTQLHYYTLPAVSFIMV